MPLNDYEDEDACNTGAGGQSEEDEIHFFHIGYMCDDCNYRWEAKRKASLSDEDTTGSDRWFIDDTSMNCPMCGSSNIIRV